MARYPILVNILDKIIDEAGNRYPKRYPQHETDPEKANQARARAYIHLYLKVSFGLDNFDEREHFITDDAFDGGVDGYFIHEESRTIFLIQSKFRTSAANFETKDIKLEELLVMDINRILEGETKDENGKDYNGKIKQLQREISGTENIGRYKYQVILLANLDTEITPSKMRQLTGGMPIEVINHDICYQKLVFPVISGTYYNASDLNIFIDLSNKNAGSKISYTVQTKNGECEITVLFVPTIEVAKILHKYKNSILKFNPRSYLELDGQKVNQAIRETILNQTTNEFALFNNGITMLSDETNINEKIGQKNKAQLTVKNPQIINGGQTAYTLSKIYSENIANSDYVFENKEVLLKVITLNNQEKIGASDVAKMELIDQISTATNQQTAVITADRFSNDRFHVKLQETLFSKYGILYERKRGEFGDGVNNGYIKSTNVLERNLFFRLLYASGGGINRAIEKRLFQKQDLNKELFESSSVLDKFYFGFLCYQKLGHDTKSSSKKSRNLWGQVFVMTRKYMPATIANFAEEIDKNIAKFKDEWARFGENISTTSTRYNLTYIEKGTKEVKAVFSLSKWHKSGEFEKDVKEYFNLNS